MASHKSTKKSVRKSERQRLVNMSRTSRIKTFIKKVDEAIAQKLNKEKIFSLFSGMQKEIMRGAAKRVFHKNAAARKISRICKRVKLATGENI